jgi:acetoin utilization protein AcuB
MIVSMWMTRDVVTVPLRARLDEAANILAENRIRRLPVLREFAGEKVLVGMLSKTDLLHAYPPHVNPLREGPFSGMDDLPTVEETMSSPVVSIGPDEPIENAAALMRSRKIGALPVMSDGELVGMITESDLFEAFSALLTGGDNPVRVTFDGLDDQLDGFAEGLARAARRSKMRLATLISFEWKGRQRAVARAVGPDPEAFLDEIRGSGYRILSVQRP